MTKLLSLLLIVLVQQQHYGIVEGQRTLVSLSKKLKILRESDKKASNVKSNPPTTTGSGTLKGKGYDYLWNRLWADSANTDDNNNDDDTNSKGILATTTTLLLFVLAAASVLTRQAMLLQREYYCHR